MSVRSLLESRLVMVTGKGGTGKTTYAAALAVLGSVLGKRTVLCELDTQRPSTAAIFGVTPHYEPQAVHPNLDLCNIRWEEALETWLRRMVPVGRVVKLILDNRVVRRFLDFTPGSREVVTLSRVDNLRDDYDLVVVDMPASGHAFSQLDVLHSVLRLFRSGPVRERAEQLREMILRDDTRMIFVAIPEEMVVNETLETLQKMREAHLLGGPPTLFLNRATLPSLVADERSLIARLGELELDALQQEFVRAGVWEDRLEQATDIAQRRLGEAFPDGPILVPPAGAGGVPRHAVEAVAVHLGRMVGVTRRDLPWI